MSFGGGFDPCYCKEGAMQPAEGTDTACAALYPNFLLIYNRNVCCFDLIMLASGLLALNERYDQIYGFQAEQLSCKTRLLNTIPIVSVNLCQLPRACPFKCESLNVPKST
jgi:hypothetical protein